MNHQHHLAAKCCNQPTFKLRNSRQRQFLYDFHRRLIKSMGPGWWLQQQVAEFDVIIQMLDEETAELEQGGLNEANLARRRLLNIQISEEWHNLTARVMLDHEAEENRRDWVPNNL